MFCLIRLVMGKASLLVNEVWWVQRYLRQSYNLMKPGATKSIQGVWYASFLCKWGFWRFSELVVTSGYGGRAMSTPLSSS